MEDQIAEILRCPNAGEEMVSQDTVFSAILQSDLPPEEVSLVLLQHEAISVVGAGIETTLRALSVAGFH